MNPQWTSSASGGQGPESSLFSRFLDTMKNLSRRGSAATSADIDDDSQRRERRRSSATACRLDELLVKASSAIQCHSPGGSTVPTMANDKLPTSDPEPDDVTITIATTEQDVVDSADDESIYSELVDAVDVNDQLSLISGRF